MTTFQFRYDQWCGWVLGPLGIGPRFILHIEPPTKGRVAGVKVNVKELALSFKDPEGFLAAINMTAD